MGTRNFTREEVLLIREMAARGDSAPIIAQLFPEVGLETLRRIIRRETYREVGSVAPEIERPSVRARLEGETVDAKRGELERQAAESLAELTKTPIEVDNAEDPVQAFLGIRRSPESPGKG